MKFVSTKKGMTTNFFSPLSFAAVLGSGIRDPGSGMGKNQDPGSEIRDKHPGPQPRKYSQKGNCAIRIMYSRKGNCGLIPNFYIYISLSDLYISTIGLPIWLQEIGGQIVGEYVNRSHIHVC